MKESKERITKKRRRGMNGKSLLGIVLALTMVISSLSVGKLTTYATGVHEEENCEICGMSLSSEEEEGEIVGYAIYFLDVEKEDASPYSYEDWEEMKAFYQISDVVCNVESAEEPMEDEGKLYTYLKVNLNLSELTEGEASPAAVYIIMDAYITGIDAPVKTTGLDSDADCGTTGVNITNIEWKAGDKPCSTYAAPSTAYTVYVTLEAETGYQFDYTPYVEINGEEAVVEITSMDYTQIKASYTFPATAAADSTKNWTYNAATNTIHLTYPIPTEFTLGSAVPGLSYIDGGDETDNIARVGAVWGCPNTSGFEYQNRKWHQANLISSTFIANQQYGYIIVGNVTSTHTSGQWPKIKINGVEFQSVHSNATEWFIVADLGTTDETGNLNGGDFTPTEPEPSEPEPSEPEPSEPEPSEPEPSDNHKKDSKDSSSSHSGSTSTAQTTTPVKTYNAVENTGKGGGTTASYNGAYSANAEGSAGNLGNHNKATEPYNADNATTTGWALIKNDIAARSVVDATKKTNSLGDNYTVVMNGATRVDNEVIRSLQSSFVSNLTLAMENGASFVVPTTILKTNPAGILANGSQPDFYLDITCNTTRDVQKGILDTQFVPLSTIKANQGDESSRMIAVRTNNADMSKLATITLQQTDPSKTKARICIYDATRGQALPYQTVTFTKGMASFPIMLGNWNLFVVEE